MIYDHLPGKQTIGVYPLLPGDVCRFLAVEFDGTEWVDDVSAFLETCHSLQVPATLERSRSGNGGHVWILFTEPVQASLARQLGSAILTKTMEKLVTQAISDKSLLCVKVSTLEEDNVEDPWTLPPSGVKKRPTVNYPIPEKVSIVLGDLIYFDKEELPAGLQNQLIQLAAFQNPEFYKAQAMRRSTYNLSRILFCSEEFPKLIGLPRGCLPEVENLFNSLGIEIKNNRRTFQRKTFPSRIQR